MSAAAIQGLTKRYGTTLALDAVSLRLEPGEIRGLLGPNGAGKTSLLRVLFGLTRADAGEVELLGRRLPVTGGGDGRSGPPAGVAGFVEAPAFYPYLSGRTNLELLVELYDADATEIEPALQRVGLTERAGDRVAGYSTGMRQRLGIAAALLRDPRLLLLDEPTSGLDPGGTRAIATLVRELSAAGTAILLSSHLIGELEALCHTYTIIRSGAVVWDGSAARLTAEAPASVHAVATGDDERALALAAEHRGVHAERLSPAGTGLRVGAEAAALDAYVVGLGRAGIPIRRLELLTSPLESMFFALTGEGAG